MEIRGNQAETQDSTEKCQSYENALSKHPKSTFINRHLVSWAVRRPLCYHLWMVLFFFSWIYFGLTDQDPIISIKWEFCNMRILGIWEPGNLDVSWETRLIERIRIGFLLVCWRSKNHKTGRDIRNQLVEQFPAGVAYSSSEVGMYWDLLLCYMTEWKGPH